MNSVMARFVILFLIIMVTTSANAQVLTFEKEEFAQRRQKLMEKIPDGIAIIRGAGEPTGYYEFSQSNDFMYFTGIEIPNAVLIIDGREKESILFFSSTERAADSEGIDVELVRNPEEITGIERYMPLDRFRPMLDRFSTDGYVFYTSFIPSEDFREAAHEKYDVLKNDMIYDEWDGRLTRELQFVRLLKERYSHVEVRDCSGVIEGLRIIKSEAEIAKIRRAGQIGVKALTEAIRSTRTSMYEYEIASLYEYYCKKEGVRDLAYITIISSDKNHPYLHYHNYDRLLKSGDFLVIDAGPDVDYYDIDISISYPANGRFTASQKEFYTACLEIQSACLKYLKAGRTPEQVGQMAKEDLESRGFDLTAKYWDKLSMFLKRGAVSHYVGMAVHDIGGTARSELKTGMVLAMDVYAVWPDENMGVRIEDTVVITDEGYENLSPGLPRTIEEIEDLMETEGAIQVLKKSGRY
ncbi:MAG: Xaa-Pro peptidase family protein [Bacteroidales bacterium]|jgi:Xaa-Pro aminopeptidase|nr:Xaa-Pro peptidase family protein [Bacteroidales bacterium]